MPSSGRRRGLLDGYWSAQVVSSGDVSNTHAVGRGADNFAIYISVDKASTFNLQVAHSGNETDDGILPDESELVPIWHDCYVFQGGPGSLIELTFTGAGKQAGLVDGFSPNWTRLICTAGTNVTVTAGYEIEGDS